MVSMALLLLLLGLPVSGFKADVVAIDMTGWETYAEFGHPLNSEFFWPSTLVRQ